MPKYFIRLGKRGEALTPVDGEPVLFVGFEEFDFFIHRRAYLNEEDQVRFTEEWSVSEKRTGLKVTVECSARKEDMLAASLETLKKFGVEGVRRGISSSLEVWSEIFYAEAPGVRVIRLRNKQKTT